MSERPNRPTEVVVTETSRKTFTERVTSAFKGFASAFAYIGGIFAMMNFVLDPLWDKVFSNKDSAVDAPTFKDRVVNTTVGAAVAGCIWGVVNFFKGRQVVNQAEMTGDQFRSKITTAHDGTEHPMNTFVARGGHVDAYHARNSQAAQNPQSTSPSL